MLIFRRQKSKYMLYSYVYIYTLFLALRFLLAQKHANLAKFAVK